MPLIKSLSKVLKKLAKQSSGSLHVKGRKFKQLNRATEREHKIKAKKAQFAEQKNHELLFYLHLQETLNEQPEKASYDVPEMRAILEGYISRNDAEIAQMDSERRPGRPMSNRHQIMIEKRKHDRHLFVTGFRMPDLSDEDTTRRLRNWNGTSGSLSAWKFTLVTELPHEAPDAMD
ncbi:hypothetical protein METBIDRAFT_40747 [Metschnikowia bicuspidata var. bicuspidata NRRL YB-4993]|uniref:Translation machinery-associated protein 16 n=1 Tax=Metschnikowia bicuspidata var. bicuspidata NRRL YB-4993 TaxID=869754 RepID=A0A1A0HE35_9ASCO|nr:hypothetical protein METBIDRAFT_40747 [Metschnikowia bicuspidata var. bicuspidata NRRL YB-4993]OBA22364.1 hypothetical protein METBIDRAFT_40747 [Metschnikowia bicuspidata var. bicuspidata NRRL YB-4993]